VCWQFDNAVRYVLIYGENRLEERDRDGKRHKYPTVELALGLMPKPRPIDLSRFAGIAHITKG